MAFPLSNGFMFQQLHEGNDHNLINPQFFHGGGFMTRKPIDQNKCDHEEEDLSDDGSQLLGERKKRLNIEQVKALEKSFELGNKLEPERKLQLAKAIGLQPRQVAIWFQNRRARWKTKQLERDYGVLRKQFDGLKADNDALLAQNHKLTNELMTLKKKDSISEHELKMKRETDQSSWSNNGSENSYDISRSTVPVMTQFLLGSARPDLHEHDHHHNVHVVVEEETTFSNIFNGIDDQQPGFWPWQQDQHHHFH